MDSDSDDDAPLVFRANPNKRAPSMDPVRNGTISSKVLVDDVRKRLGNACQQSSEQTSDDSDEDNRLLARRVPAKRPFGSSTMADANNSDEDDDEPLVLRRATNGSSNSFKSQQKALHKDPMFKKRPSNEILKGDSDGKKLKLLPKPLGMVSKPTSSSPKPPFNTPKPPPTIPKPPSSTPMPPSSSPNNSDGDDDKPLVLRRPSNGSSNSFKSHQKALHKDPMFDKRPPNEILKGDSDGKKLKLLPKPLDMVSKATSSSPKPPFNTPKPSPTIPKPPSSTPGPRSSSPNNSDGDDDKPLVLRRATNGSSNSFKSHQKALHKDPTFNKRSPNEILKGDSDRKKLKLFPKPLGMVSKPISSSPKPPFNTPKPPPTIPKPPSSPPRPPSSSPKPFSTSALKPSSSSFPKPSSNLVLKPTSSTPKPSSDSVSPMTSPKRSTASPIPPPPSIESSKLPDTSTNAAGKMEIDEDQDDVPLAKRISVPEAAKKVVVVNKTANSLTSDAAKKHFVVKKTENSLTSSVAARKLFEAKKAKLKQQQKLMSKKVKGEKNAPGAGGGQKWTTLEHNGVIFPPPYKPHGIKMLYEKKPVTLTPEQEEVATMFAVMRDTDYATKPQFLSNFWNDWKKILGPNHVIQSLEGCDFTPIYQWHLEEKEKKKQMSTEEKKRLREEKQQQEEKYMWALLDGVKEKVGNFRVEPPGLFRGRGEHPKMGKLKRRIFPEDIVINIGKDAKIPECSIEGHRWKEIRHDNTVTWLAYWNDPINTREFKYVFLGASSTLKGQSDKEKYEKARRLKDYIDDIRRTYTRNFTSSNMMKRQIAVATYLIDQLALRAGNEKDDDEADTVGCCSLKVEHVTLVPPRSLQFDFLGKDSIRYFNTVEVVEPVYKAIGDFKNSKKNGHDLFDQLDTTKLNAHLKNIMPHLTAKVFRTYNASITLDRLLVDTDGHTVQDKIASYQKANKEVAILCNHQRSVSKSHGAQMERLEGKMAELKELVKELRTDLDRARRGKPPLKDADGKPKRNQNPELLEKKIAQTEIKIEKMELDMRIKDELKTVALGTSKINYMDPRITVAWCKRHEVPIEKIFNKSLLAKFSWAMDVDMDYQF